MELDSTIYYDISKASNASDLKTNVTDVLNSYSKNVDMNRFGGRFKYSKVLQLIDRVDDAITSNITKIIIRRDLKALVNQFAQYELCYGNQFHVKSGGFNIKSTGFRIATDPDVVYLTDIPNPDGKTGILSIVKPITSESTRVVVKSAGTIDYIKGEINMGKSTILPTAAAIILHC